MAFTPVRVKNVGEDTFRDRWEGQLFTIAPGEVAIVPEYGAWCWFGNPEVLNTTFHKDRDDEFFRLRCRYGAYDDADLWQQNMPRVEVFNTEGERIWTVVEDPQGDHVTPVTTTAEEKANLMVYIRQMQEEIRQMKERAASLPDPDMVESDEPHNAPRGRTRSA